MSIETEKQTIEKMIHLFCKLQHGTEGTLCPECTELLDYSDARLDHCPFGEKKPICRTCSVHCYKPEMRQRISEVMRFAGPRMACRHPLSALRHLIRSLRRN